MAQVGTDRKEMDGFAVCGHAIPRLRLISDAKVIGLGHAFNGILSLKQGPNIFPIGFGSYQWHQHEDDLTIYCGEECRIIDALNTHS